jgi:acyl-CoA synthetase (AMP-forming)/AMP-acid ligase II
LEHSDAKLLFADQKRMQGLDSLNNVKKIITTYTPDSSFTNFSDFIKDHSTSFPEVNISRNDHATIYYTSGSTGKPKGVLSSQKAVIATLFSWACFSSIMKEVDNQKDPNTPSLLDEASAILLCVPLFHVTGSHAGMFMSILVGRKIVMMKKWDAGIALQLIEQEKISDITGVPTQTW